MKSRVKKNVREFAKFIIKKRVFFDERKYRDFKPDCACLVAILK